MRGMLDFRNIVAFVLRLRVNNCEVFQTYFEDVTFCEDSFVMGVRESSAG